MTAVAITGSGLYTPPHSISNDELVACYNAYVERFNADNAAAQLASLKETSRWKRKSFVEDGKWTTLADLDEPVDGAAELCAERLAEVELPMAQPTDTTSNTESAIQ